MNSQIVLEDSTRHFVTERSTLTIEFGTLQAALQPLEEARVTVGVEHVIPYLAGISGPAVSAYREFQTSESEVTVWVLGLGVFSALWVIPLGHVIYRLLTERSLRQVTVRSIVQGLREGSQEVTPPD